MSVCVLQNLEKDRVLWTDFLASCRKINRFSVSKIGPKPAKPTISLALFDMEVAQCSLTFLRERYLHRCREQSFAIRAYAMSTVGI